MKTVLVKGWSDCESHKNGVLINESDFDENVHSLFGKKESENDFLKRTAAEIIADLPACTTEELTAYLADEKTGKDRAGVVKSIESELSGRAE